MALRTRLHHRNPREHPCTLARHGPRKTSNRKGSSLAGAVRGALALAVLARNRPARGVQSELARGAAALGGPGALALGGPSALALDGPVRGWLGAAARGGPGAAGGLGAAALGAGLLPG